MKQDVRQASSAQRGLSSQKSYSGNQPCVHVPGQASLLEASAGRERAEAELAAALSMLGTVRRQLAAYRDENAALLASYDDWLARQRSGASRVKGALMWHEHGRETEADDWRL